MRVLVTGASGFLGHHIINKLKSEGCDVIAIVRNSSVVDDLQTAGVKLISGDLRDEACIMKAVKDVDAIVHAAATMGGSWDDYYDINVKSTELLLKHASKTRIKHFVFISSIIVYDHSGSDPGMTFTEWMPYEQNNLTNYSRSKIEAEKVIAKYAKKTPTVILRPGALYGGSGPIYPARLGFSLGSGKYLVIGDGNREIPLSHVDSVADAVWTSMNRKGTTGKSYNILEDGAITQNDYLNRVKTLTNPKLRVLRLSYKPARILATMIQKGLGLAGMSSPIRLPYLRLCSTQFYYPNDLAKRDLGWQPQSSLESSIDEMLNKFVDAKKPSRNVPHHKGKILLPTDEKLNVGMVGCGMFAETHLKILQKFKNTNVVAICDPNQEAREKLAKKFKVSKTYENIQKMLSSEKIDAVHIVTPAQTHLELALAAIKKKCHVLVEKPVALNAKEAKKMFAAAKKHNIKLTVDHNHVFDEVMIKARETIGKGALGKIAYVESWYATSYSSNSKNRYLRYNAKDMWVYKLPGSLYQNMISHPISLLTDVMGKVKEAKASTQYMHIVPHMQNDELRVLVEGEKMLGSIHMSLAITPRYHSVNIYGTKGTLKVDFLNKFIFHDKVVPMLPKVISRNMMIVKHAATLLFSTLRNAVNILRRKHSLFEGNERLIHLFYRSILLDEPVPISQEEALQSMEIMDEIWKQIDKKKTNETDLIRLNGNGRSKPKSPQPRKRKTTAAKA